MKIVKSIKMLEKLLMEVLTWQIKYEIKETLGELSESTKTWRKELNLISWNDKEAKYNI